MKHWIKRNWPMALLAILLFTAWSRIHWLTAHAQKPEPPTSGITFSNEARLFTVQPSCEEGMNVVLGDDPKMPTIAVCHDGKYRQAVNLGSWIEQHCVAVFPMDKPSMTLESRTGDLPKEVTLRLRCQ